MTIFNIETHRGVFAKDQNPANNERLWWQDLLARMVQKMLTADDVHVGPTAPVDTTKLWYQGHPTYAGNGTFFYYEGAVWQTLTAGSFYRFLRAKGGGALPANALGYLKNDGAGVLSWDAGDLSVNTVAAATGNITLNGNYDVTDLTLVGNITLNAVSNWVPNRPHFVRFRQDATGGRTISINSGVFKVGQIAITGSVAANAIDVLAMMARTNAVAELTMWNKGVQ